MPFENVVIHMDGPICQCKVHNLSWSCPTDTAGHTYLVIKCKTCMVTLTVPHEKFIAGWQLKIPYPGEDVSGEGAPKTPADPKRGNVKDKLPN